MAGRGCRLWKGSDGEGKTAVTTTGSQGSDGWHARILGSGQAEGGSEGQACGSEKGSMPSYVPIIMHHRLQHGWSKAHQLHPLYPCSHLQKIVDQQHLIPTHA